jgi:hypothetical protein
VAYEKRKVYDYKGKPLEVGAPDGINILIKKPENLTLTCVFHPEMKLWMMNNLKGVADRSGLKNSITFVESELAFLRRKI